MSNLLKLIVGSPCRHRVFADFWYAFAYLLLRLYALDDFISKKFRLA
jgi:hypothetical protein